MDHKIKTVRYPEYLKQFQCTGPLCRDNCCIGWDVDIDKKTYFKYQKVNNEALMTFFKKYVHQNREAYSDDVDFARVKLLEDKRCPFLNDKNLCMIQAKMGEGYLSNVCATYPRFTNLVNGIKEKSATVSCPEVARLILGNKAGLKFFEEEQENDLREIIMFQADTHKAGQNILVTCLLELRAFTISVLQNRDHELYERLMILGFFFNDLQKLAKGGRSSEVGNLIREYEKGIRENKFREKIKDLPISLPDQMKILSGLSEQLHVQDEIDSKTFIALTGEHRRAIYGRKPINFIDSTKRYDEASKVFFKPFMANKGYILENYLVNYVFGNLFPAGESEKPFEAYSLLVCRYALIRHYLIGIAASRQGLSEDLAVEFIQVFSKAVEHHKTFIEKIPSYLQREKYNSLDGMLLLLKNQPKANI